MGIWSYSTKDIGNFGEKAAAEYLRRLGFVIVGTNIRAPFGELDIIAAKENCLHIVEVKSLKCSEFPGTHALEVYDPGQNLHQNKIRKVARMATWYAGSISWEGEWQIDGALVWLREYDGMARIKYYPQIL